LKQEKEGEEITCEYFGSVIVPGMLPLLYDCTPGGMYQ